MSDFIREVADSLGDRKMSPIMRRRLQQMEQVARRWAVLVARGHVSAAEDLTRRAYATMWESVDAGCVTLRQAGIRKERVEQLDKIGVKTINDFLNSSESDLLRTFDPARDNWPRWRKELYEIHRQISLHLIEGGQKN